jgi:hypothetical protein
MLMNTVSSTVIQTPGEIEKKACLLTRKNNPRLACNISAYARARKLLLDKVSRYKNFNDRISYVK